MSRKHMQSREATVTCAVFMALAAPSISIADSFVQTNLVSDVPGMAYTTDANLKNPWGVSFSPTSPFWISNQASGTSTLYNGLGVPTALVVGIPGSSIPPSGPTGQVFNGTTGFNLPNNSPAHFIFDTLNGTIDGWNGGSTAIQMVSTPGAVYTGLAMATSGGSSYLYAADSTGQIRVFNSSFAPTTLAGNFTDPNAVAGYTPFNIQLIGNDLYVTYARLTPQGAALSGGYVDVFDTSGDFLSRLSSGGALFAPWGITLAPAGFGSYGNDLLVGNFGNGEILAYNPANGDYLGTLDGMNGQPLVNDNLWALDFRTGGTGVNTDALYFTAGINNQADGLFGEITVAPEPSTAIFTLLGVCGLGLLRYRRSTPSRPWLGWY
jgi:uncharacterized protein (TIGR03118 family)